MWRASEAFCLSSALMGRRVCCILRIGQACPALPQSSFSFIPSRSSSGSTLQRRPTGFPTVIKRLCRGSSEAFQQEDLGMLRTRLSLLLRVPGEGWRMEDGGASRSLSPPSCCETARQCPRRSLKIIPSASRRDCSTPRRRRAASLTESNPPLL